MHVLEPDLWSVLEEQSKARPEVLDHLKTCEMCQERLDDLKLYMESTAEVALDPTSATAARVATRLFESARAGLTIPLSRLVTETEAGVPSLAADGQREPKAGHRSLATLYSEDPEMVLRVMRDESAGQSYIQLISEDPTLISNVIVEIPEAELEVVTDQNGRADLTDEPVLDSRTMAWQVRLPNAEFKLAPLTFDPDSTEYSEAVTLQTDRQDRVKVTFEGKADGKQLLIQILELGGEIDFKPVTLVVSQDRDLSILGALPGQAAKCALVDSKSEIKIRLFG